MAQKIINKKVYQFDLSVDSTKTFTSTEVDIVNNNVLVVSHGIATGTACGLATTGAVPTGLTALTTAYYIIAVDTHNVAFATSRANALAGTKIDLTAVGSGTTTIHQNGFGDVIMGTVPDGLLVTNAWYQVTTTFTSPTGVDNAQIALGVVANGDLVAAVAINGTNDPWDAGMQGTLAGTPALSVFHASNNPTALELINNQKSKLLIATADRAILANVTVDTLSAGALKLFVEGFQGV